MKFEFKLPDLGEGMVEGEVVKWHVREGASIREDDPMLDIMTDKATVTVPSPCEGKVLQLFAKEGEVKKVGSVLIVMETKSVHAAPATRHLAEELGVELSRVSGTGPEGRITTDDVKQFAGTGKSDQNQERIPLRGLRRKISEKMSLSHSRIPQYTYVEEADVSELILFRDRADEKTAAKGIRLSYLPFFIQAAVEAIRKFPIMNSALDEEKQEIILKHDVHVGVAAATPEGLTVPVLKNAGEKTILEIAKEVNDLGEKARAGKLAVEDLQGSTFTITSLGPLGGILATPIINYPETAILGIHRIEKRPVVVNNQIVIRDRVNLSLSLDHRVIDGDTGAKFVQEIISRLENPAKFFVVE